MSRTKKDIALAQQMAAQRSESLQDWVDPAPVDAATIERVADEVHQILAGQFDHLSREGWYILGRAEGGQAQPVYIIELIDQVQVLCWDDVWKVKQNVLDRFGAAAPAERQRPEPKVKPVSQRAEAWKRAVQAGHTDISRVPADIKHLVQEGVS